MQYKLENALIRQIDASTKIIEHFFIRKNESYDAVFAELDGYHGRYLNKENEKIYFVNSGKMEFEVESQRTLVGPNEIFCIPPKVWHSMRGYKAHMVILATPPFDPKNEILEGSEAHKAYNASLEG